jgi:hypothetical protein
MARTSYKVNFTPTPQAFFSCYRSAPPFSYSLFKYSIVKSSWLGFEMSPEPTHPASGFLNLSIVIGNLVAME